MVLGILKTKDYRTFDLCGNIVEGAQKVNRGLPGDTMSDDFEVVLRADHKGIVGVLELAGKTRYGFTARNTPIYLFSPWNESYPPFYVGSSHKDTSTNVLAVIDFDGWEPSKNCPRGNCREIIGSCGDLQSEEKALLAHLKPQKWKNPLVINPPLPPAEGGSRLEGNTFHIDPPGCRDIDDALTMWTNEDGSTEVRIHIANVASTLATNHWLFEAAHQGQTIYKDGAVVSGMFPASVEEKLSLLPYQHRMTVTLGFTYFDSTITNLRWFQQEIEVKESYTYETILLSRHCALLREITSCIAKRDLDDPHDWVAEFMLFYNKEAARWLYDNCSGVLRRHSPPDMDRLRVLESVGTVPPHLAYSSGEYCSPTSGLTAHWGLGVDVYCHASSPIRRWADCLNQADLIDILFGQYLNIPLADIDNLNMMAKAIKKYERDLTFVRVLMGPDSVREVSGIVVERCASKMRLWVEDWKQIVTVKGSYDFLPGATLDLKIFFDAGQRNWKRRMILSVVP
jgi:exoribonuclease R